MPSRVVVISSPARELVRQEVLTQSKKHGIGPDDLTNINAAATGDYSPVARLADALTDSLFADPGPVHVDQLDAADDELVELLKAQVESEGPPIFVSHYGTARGKGLINAVKKAKGQVITIAKPREGDIRQLIRAEARKYGARLAPQVEDWLMSSGAGDDLSILLGAIRQACQEAEENEVTLDQIHTQFPEQVKVTSFQIADLVWKGQTAQAVRLLRAMETLDPSTPVSVCAALTLGVRQMALARSSTSMPSWQRDRARRNQTSWGASEERMRNIASFLAQLDAAVKGGLDGEESLDDEQKRALLEQTLVGLALQ